MKYLVKNVLWLALCTSTLNACGDESDLGSAADVDNGLTTDAGAADIEEGLVFSPLSAGGDVVAFVELDRYVGEWFEIATTPSRQQEACAGTKAIYTPEDGRIGVTNQCFQGSLEGRLQQVEGFAEVVDSETNAKLDVNFFGFRAPYWVIALDGSEGDSPYSWAVVSGPSNSSLWLLSRTAQLTPEDRAEIESYLVERGVDTSRWIDTLQPEAELP